MSDRFDSVYMGTALLYARQSKAQRKKVGAVLVTNKGVLLPGYNGTPSGASNECEDRVYSSDGEYTLVTKPEVIHAELNCVLKAAKEGISIVGSSLYVTLSPCETCAAMLVQAGVSSVSYLEQYRETKGIDYLLSNGVRVSKIEL